MSESLVMTEPEGLRPGETFVHPGYAWCPVCGAAAVLVFLPLDPSDPIRTCQWACVDPDEAFCGWREGDGGFDTVIVDPEEDGE